MMPIRPPQADGGTRNDVFAWCCKGRQKIEFDVQFTVLNTGDGYVVAFQGDMTRTVTSVCMHKQEGCGKCKRVWPDEDSWFVEGEEQGSREDSLTRDGWHATGVSFLQIELPCCNPDLVYPFTTPPTTGTGVPCPPAVKKEKFKVSGKVPGALYSDQYMGVGHNMVNRVAHALLAEYGVGGTQPPTFLACCKGSGDPNPPNTKCWKCYYQTDKEKPVCKQNVDRVKGKCPDGSYNAKDKCEKKMWEECPGGDPK